MISTGSRKLLAANMRNRAMELPRIFPQPPVHQKEMGHFDLTSRQVFDATPDCVLHAAINQMLQPLSANVLANELTRKYVDVSNGSFDHFDFHANHKEALVTTITQLMKSTNRTKVLHAAGNAPEGLEMVENANIMTFLTDIDSWDDSIALGVFHQKLCNAHPQSVAALILSPVSSQNGFKPYSREFLIGCQDLCDRYGIQLIVDETEIGFGRTGPAFACSTFENFQPDMLITTAPSTNFLPVAVVCSKMRRGPPLMDIGPVTMASANAAIDYFMDNDLPTRTMEKAEVLRKGFGIMGTRASVYGLCGSIDLKEPSFAAQTLHEDAHITVDEHVGGINFKLPLLTSGEELSKLTQVLGATSASEKLQPWDASLPLV